MNIYRITSIIGLLCCTIIASTQNTISFAQLFQTGDMTPYIGQTIQLTDTLHLNGWGSQMRYMWVSDHRAQNECEQGNMPREVFTFSLTDNNVNEYKRLGTKIANVTMRVTTAEYATLIGNATYVNDVRPNQHNHIGDYSLKVCGFNVEKFFIDVEGYETKTVKVVEALKNIDADIFGLCEVGEYPSAMYTLAATLNNAIGDDIYAATLDNIKDSTTYSRSGYLYKKALVTPYGGFTEASTSYIYKKRNIIQGFTENATGEKFILSMNHFKAKDTTTDESEGTRIDNATELINTLNNTVPYKYNDDDILILGDLNSCTGEIPLQMLYDEGYSCMMNKFEPNGYSIVYNRTVERLDHALASASMAAQVTGATTYHINTDERSGNTELNMYRSSDHDPVIIGLRLADDATKPSDECEGVKLATTFKNGLSPFTQQSVSGSQMWFSDANYGARMSGYASGNNENIDWLISPALDLSNHSAAQLTFRHAINYDSNNKKSEYQTLWITDNYGGDVQTATWEQLTIPVYPNGANWTYASAGNIDIPQKYFKKNVRIAFKYISTTSESNATWQITDFNLQGTCAGTSLPQIEATKSFSVFVVDKEVNILRQAEGVSAIAILYDSMGQQISTKTVEDKAYFKISISGIYLLKIESEVYKIFVP